MGWVFRGLSLTAIEVAWRWLFGIPLLFICWNQGQQILAAFPLESSGFNSLDAQNPWVAVVQLAGVVAYYQPARVWPCCAGSCRQPRSAWVVVSGLGRNLVLKRIDPRLPFRPSPMIALAGSMARASGRNLLAWFLLHAVGCGHAHHRRRTRPGRLRHLGHLSFAGVLHRLGACSAGRSRSRPLLMLLERRSALSSLVRACGLAKAFTSKLAEINLVMGIVKLALIVLAMVFSAAPLPFSDELGGDAFHMSWASLHCLLSRGERLLPGRALERLRGVLANLPRPVGPISRRRLLRRALARSLFLADMPR